MEKSHFPDHKPPVCAFNRRKIFKKKSPRIPENSIFARICLSYQNIDRSIACLHFEIKKWPIIYLIIVTNNMFLDSNAFLPFLRINILMHILVRGRPPFFAYISMVAYVEFYISAKTWQQNTPRTNKSNETTSDGDNDNDQILKDGS